MNNSITNNKVALISGASRGIGAAVAKLYAQLGFDLILLGRDVAALENTDDIVQSVHPEGKPATLVPFDITKFDAIDHLATQIAGKYKKLDVLVGNAAILGELCPIHDITPEIWQNVINTNLTANWRLIRAFHPLLLRSKSANLLLVTSSVAKSTPAYWGVYTVSKAALEAMARTYAAENLSSNINVRIIDPGANPTDMRAKAFPLEDQNNLPDIEKTAQLFVDALKI